ncbi:MAG: DUF1761 domain-containing protein [Candidatus Kaiserbacteria bacterium]|nr:DUF1761 domain-containing protein [Candidatus Kaiserbacteria bacterium]
MFEPTLLRIFFAGLASVVIGIFWYHPRVLGTLWMRYSGITPETVERGKGRMHLMTILALLASMFAAYVLNIFGIAGGVFDITGAVKLAVLAWAGFVAPALLGSIIWEQKPVAYDIINSLFWLVALVAMSVVLVI